MPPRVRWWLLLAVILFLTGCAARPVALPARDVPVSEDAAQALDEKLAQLGNLPNGEVTLRFSEREVTSYLRHRVVSRLPLPLVEPTVWFSGGHVYVAGRLRVPVVPVQPQVVVVLTALAQDGHVAIQVRRASINGIALPAPVLERLSSAANSWARNAIAPLRVRDLQVLEGEVMIVVGR